MAKKLLFLALYLLFLCSESLYHTRALRAEAVNFNPDIAISSEAATLFNLDTDTAVYQKNSEKKMFPASTTKIMTYIIVVESTSDLENTKIEVKSSIIDMLKGTDSSLSGLKAGEVYTAKKLLEGMMIASGNDAALVLASHFGRNSPDISDEDSIKIFVDRMNEKAREIGCLNTNFTNPHGLHNNDHFTTSDDLAKIAKYGRKVPGLELIMSQTQVYMKEGDKIPATTTSVIIDKDRGGDKYYSYAKAAKTGFTDEAGRCIVLIAERSGQRYICVVLGDFSKEGCHIKDAKTLCDWAFENLLLKLIIDKKKLIGKVKLNYAWKQDSLPLVASDNVYCLLPKNVDVSSVSIKLNQPESVNAPVAAGDKICTATLSYANQELGVVTVVAMNTVEENHVIHASYVAKDILTSIWLKISVISTVLFFCGINLKTMLDRKREIKRNNLQKYKKYKDQQSHRR
ncbi:MAG: serine hydrolase [Oscillospiraceae bacterium]|nr:serine hydrolase [Oscillospiraceae bacterium]